MKLFLKLMVVGLGFFLITTSFLDATYELPSLEVLTATQLVEQNFLPSGAEILDTDDAKEFVNKFINLKEYEALLKIYKTLIKHAPNLWQKMYDILESNFSLQQIVYMNLCRYFEGILKNLDFNGARSLYQKIIEKVEDHSEIARTLQLVIASTYRKPEDWIVRPYLM